MDFNDKLRAFLKEPLEHRGWHIAYLQADPDLGQHTIAIEGPNAESPTAGECASVHRLIRGLLLGANFVKGELRFSVSSPGLDRPLLCIEDYQRFLGKPVDLLLKKPLEGTTQKRYRTRVLACEEDGVVFALEGQEAEGCVPLDKILRCKLVPDLYND